MRRFALSLFAVAFLSFGANASVSMGDFFKAVINSEALTEVLAENSGTGTLKSVKRSVTYRCPGCYQFIAEVEILDNEGSAKTQKHSFITNMDIATQTIQVSPEQN